MRCNRASVAYRARTRPGRSSRLSCTASRSCRRPHRCPRRRTGRRTCSPRSTCMRPSRSAGTFLWCKCRRQGTWTTWCSRARTARCRRDLRLRTGSSICRRLWSAGRHQRRIGRRSSSRRFWRKGMDRSSLRRLRRPFGSTLGRSLSRSPSYTGTRQHRRSRTPCTHGPYTSCRRRSRSAASTGAAILRLRLEPRSCPPCCRPCPEDTASSTYKSLHNRSSYTPTRLRSPCRWNRTRLRGGPRPSSRTRRTGSTRCRCRSIRCRSRARTRST